MFRRIQVQILVLLAVIAAISIAMILVYRAEQLRQLQTMLRDRHAASDSLLATAVSLVSKSTATMAYDYSQWDETVEFVGTRDTAWARENIDIGLGTYESQIGWVLDTGYQVLYAANTEARDELNELPVSPDAIAAILRSGWFGHFYARTAGEIVECRIAPIQPSADDERLTPPHGYLVIGRLWNAEFISDLNTLTSARTQLQPVAEMHDHSLSPSAFPRSIVNHRILTSWDGSPLVEVCAESEFTVGQSFVRFMRRMLWGSVVLSILMLGIVTLFLFHRVSRPLTRIVGALRTGDPRPLEPLCDSDTEFGTIARLTREFLAQRDELRSEYAQRERAEQEVRRSVSLLEATLESTADGILVVDSTGHVTSCNQRFLDMWRIPADLASRHEDRALLDFVLSQLEDPRSFLDGVEKLYAHPDQTSSDVLTFIDGRVFERYSQPQRVEQRIVGRVWSFRDVTRQRRSDVERKHLESQLRRSQKMETIGTLAGGVAHDFNNILTPILGYADMSLMQLPADSPTRPHLESITRAALRARDLVRQILAFSRQTEQEHRPMLVQLIVKEATKLLRASIPSTIEIMEEIDSNAPAVNCDPSQIHQVLMNLCANAAHAMREQGGTLSVELTRLDVARGTELPDVTLGPGTYVCLVVGDTGTGMDAATFERIYEPFFTTKEAGEGTGLGLSVVHGIVKAHGGQISARTERGQGTEFRVYLPCTEVMAQREVPASGGAVSGHGNILVVDDEPENVSLVQDMLNYLGYDVDTCASAAEALAKFRTDPAKYDVVVTDQTMPRMTGAQLAAELLLIRPDTPIILATGFSEVVSQHNYQRYGMRELIMKPIVARDLHDAIQRCITTAAIS